MKPELQKELKEKVKPGVKPSQLKRSQSLGDIPKAPLPKLTKSKSAEELETQATREELETKISTLELKLEVSQRELAEKEIEKQNAFAQKILFEEQLREKQKELESLREKLEAKASEQALDQALNQRHQNLKDWFKAYQKTKSLDQELTENINEASDELISQDQKISYLQSQNFKLKQEKQSLQKDLQLTQRLAEMRRNSLSEDNWLPAPSFSWIAWALTFVALWIWTKKYD